MGFYCTALSSEKRRNKMLSSTHDSFDRAISQQLSSTALFTAPCREDLFMLTNTRKNRFNLQHTLYESHSSLYCMLAHYMSVYLITCRRSLSLCTCYSYDTEMYVNSTSCNAITGLFDLKVKLIPQLYKVNQRTIT